MIGYPVGKKRREKRGENLSEEIMAENFPHLAKETADMQVQEAKRLAPSHTHVHAHTGVPLSQEKERDLVTCDNMYRPGGYHAE